MKKSCKLAKLGLRRWLLNQWILHSGNDNVFCAGADMDSVHDMIKKDERVEEEIYTAATTQELGQAEV
ncbi:hypothetical protein L1987_36705 [Smallanthus sonchifolius]|uniref:Uncharacterized protein n=1 Tax=Smallanthus sonchifolius TaxID=185202 RepID=A0ACB9HFP1_9ASTR|nr:hypothetical protein L1987_36705 [Smallanthus sonchifolius]